jgi:hypothetical protein
MKQAIFPPNIIQLVAGEELAARIALIFWLLKHRALLVVAERLEQAIVHQHLKFSLIFRGPAHG